MSLNEKCAIGAALLNTEAADELCTLSEKDFSLEGNAQVFKIIKKLRKNNKQVDLMIVASKLNPNMGIDETVLVDYTTDVPAPSNYRMYVQGIREESQRRTLLKLGQKLVTTAMSMDTEPEELRHEALDTLRTSYDSTDLVTQEEACAMFMDCLNAKGKNDVKKVYTGIPLFDRLTNGISGGKFIAVGARPGVGKSAFALATAVNTAKKGTATLFVSLEMNEPEIIQRVVASEATINNAVLETGTYKEDELQAAVNAVNRFSGLPLFYDTRANTPEKIRRSASVVGNRTNLGLIVVDYLQLMNSGERNGSRNEEVAQISRALKLLAMDLNIPVMGLAQLNRESQKSQGSKLVSRKPTLAEFRESGAIEQDADMAILFWQPEGEGLDNELQDRVDRCESRSGRYTVLQIEKNRAGERKDIGVNFVGKYMRFEEVPPPTMKEVKGSPWSK